MQLHIKNISRQLSLRDSNTVAIKTILPLQKCIAWPCLPILFKSHKCFIQHFHSRALKSYQRIGPHKKEILDTIVGSLLGDGWGEKRCKSTRFHFHYTSKSVEYLDFLHAFFYANGYCSSKRAKKSRQIGKSGKIYYSIKLRTFSFSSWNWLYELFYSSLKQKHVPKNIGELLSPKALAIWVMDDGGVSGKGSKISTESFDLEEVKLLKAALFERFGLRYSVQRHKKKHILYLSKEQMPALQSLIQSYMLPCMYYKLNICAKPKLSQAELGKVVHKQKD